MTPRWRLKNRPPGMSHPTYGGTATVAIAINGSSTAGRRAPPITAATVAEKTVAPQGPPVSTATMPHRPVPIRAGPSSPRAELQNDTLGDPAAPGGITTIQVR